MGPRMSANRVAARQELPVHPIGIPAVRAVKVEGTPVSVRLEHLPHLEIGRVVIVPTAGDGPLVSVEQRERSEPRLPCRVTVPDGYSELLRVILEAGPQRFHALGKRHLLRIDFQQAKPGPNAISRASSNVEGLPGLAPIPHSYTRLAELGHLAISAVLLDPERAREAPANGSVVRGGLLKVSISDRHAFAFHGDVVGPHEPDILLRGPPVVLPL